MKQTSNTFTPMRGNRTVRSTAAQSIQTSTYKALESLVNMYGVDLSVYSH